MQQKRIYCLVPIELAGRLHDSLRRHFRDRPEVEVIVERRRRERRSVEERRVAEAGQADGGRRPPRGAHDAATERRRIRSVSGRRVAERRAPLVALSGTDAPELPRRARGYASQLTFVERVEPATEAAEDADTARLVTRIQAGERDLFADLYLRYFDRVYAYVRAIVRDQHEAEDTVQQAFMAAFEALPRYERRGQPFRAWLFTVVRNHALKHVKRHARLVASDPNEVLRLRDRGDRADALKTLDWVADRELMLFVERLPLAQRQVLLLRFHLGLSTSEAAKVLERTEADVRVLQSRALRFLRDRLTAIGRTARTRDRSGLRRSFRQAPVLRRRRFALGAGARAALPRR